MGKAAGEGMGKVPSLGSFYALAAILYVLRPNRYAVCPIRYVVYEVRAAGGRVTGYPVYTTSK